MENFKIFFLAIVCIHTCRGAKINTPRVLLPWFEDITVNFTFEIIEGGCYKWSLSRDDIIDLEALYDDTWGHCSRSARVSVTKSCVPPGSVIILAEEINTGEMLRGDVDIDKIKSLDVMSTTWKLYLEEAPEAFEIVAYDDQGNRFTTLEGLTFSWTIENLGNNADDELLVDLVRWKDTDYEAPPGVTALEAIGLRSYAALLYGRAMGQCRVTVCLGHICTDFTLQVVASVVLMPATALIAPGDTLRYRVVRALAGRLTIEDITDTLYYIKVPYTNIASLEDSTSLVRGSEIGTTTIILYSGTNEVATATLTVTEPYSIRVTLRPPSLLIKGDRFLINCVLLDETGHPLVSGDEILIKLSVDGEANVEFLTATQNGTVTEAMAHDSGPFIVTAKLYSVAGRVISRRVEGQVTAFVVDPLEIVPPELYVAWTDNIHELTLKHRGGGEEAVMWSETSSQGALALSTAGVLTVKGPGEMRVMVQLDKYPRVNAVGRVYSSQLELIQVWTSGVGRVGRPHHLHIALSAAHPDTGDLYNFHVCNCKSFSLALLEGPEPHNVTAATWVPPVEGACCVLETVFTTRGVSNVRVSKGRVGATARIAVRAAPGVLWPEYAAVLVGATLPVLAEGEALTPQSLEPRTVDFTSREGPAPHRHPDVQLFTLKCRRKGEARLDLQSHVDEEPESVQLETFCASHVTRMRLEPSDDAANCTGAKIWLRPGQEVAIRVTLLDAAGRELLDERGPKVSWETEPKHQGIEYRSTDRLFIETHPDYAPVPVPYKYYQLVIADEKAIGWSGVIKANVPETSGSIPAKVVAPLNCNPLRVNIAWEGDTLTNISTVTGGSGRYIVEASKGVSATVESGALAVTVPGPGSYDLVVVDQCVHGERQVVEVYIEEVLTVEVSTARAVGVGSCVPISALVMGVSRRYLSASREPDWRTTGDVTLREGRLCGLREGSGRVRAALAGVWSAEVEVYVFPPLAIVPRQASLPAGARLQLRHVGGPPPHLAALHYTVLTHTDCVQVSSSGEVQGVSLGSSAVRLAAVDAAGVEMASADSQVEVIPISNLRVRASTQTLLVGATGSLWIEAGSLRAASLASLHPPPRVVFSLRDPAAARLYTTHVDDKLDRSIAEGLTVRVVPLKAGVIAIDVRVRNLGQAAETRSWDSTIEILGISDIRTSVEGMPGDIHAGDRLALAAGSTLRLKSLPRSNWKSENTEAFEVTANGEIKALKPGYGVVVAQHKDERNNIYRESIIHIEVDSPHYCTAEASSAGSVRVVVRGQYGRELIAPAASVVTSPLCARLDKPHDSILGPELTIEGLDESGMFMTFTANVNGVTVTDEVLVTGSDSSNGNIVLTGAWGACIEGVGWLSTEDVTVVEGSGVSLAVANDDRRGSHTLRHYSTQATVLVTQLPVHKMEFTAGEWPAALVPLTVQAIGLSSGPLLCSERQRYALEGVAVQLPYTCRTAPPHHAQPDIDVIDGQIGCKIIPAIPIIDATEVDLCAEWGVFRTCTKVTLLPPVHVSQQTLSSVDEPAVFTVSGHPRALRLTKITASPGLKLDITSDVGEITVSVNNEASTSEPGYVSVQSRLTSQDIRVTVERECGAACGTILGALLAVLRPYAGSALTAAAVAVAYLYIQSRLQSKGSITMPVPPAPEAAPGPARTRTWSRSPYASRGPAVPVYGDTSSLPDSSFSPTSNRGHSRFL